MKILTIALLASFCLNHLGFAQSNISNKDLIPKTNEKSSIDSILDKSSKSGLEEKITYVEQVGNQAVVAARNAIKEYQKANPGVSAKCEYAIPHDYWNETINELNPLRIYVHKYKNFVIALESKDGIEEGVYIDSMLLPVAVGPNEGFDTSETGFRFFSPRKGWIH